MSNLFLGFPVPRAKIADMIEGSAPPKEHASNHLPNGSDPIVAPGDISTDEYVKWNGTKFLGGSPGGGGLADLYADSNYFWHTFFQSIDNFYQYVDGSGSIQSDHARLSVNSGSTASSTADIYKDPEYPIVPFTWEKTRKFHTKANLHSADDNLGHIYIVTGGHSDWDDHIGFHVNDGVLYGEVMNGINLTTVTIETLGSGAYDVDRDLECVWTLGGDVVFTVDGTDYTIASPSISGDINSERIFAIYVDNAGNAKNISCSVSEWKFYQSA